MASQLFLRREAVNAAAACGRWPQLGLLPGDFEDRFALGVIQVLADEDGSDGGSGTRVELVAQFASFYSG